MRSTVLGTGDHFQLVFVKGMITQKTCCGSLKFNTIWKNTNINSLQSLGWGGTSYQILEFHHEFYFYIRITKLGLDSQKPY